MARFLVTVATMGLLALAGCSDDPAATPDGGSDVGAADAAAESASSPDVVAEVAPDAAADETPGTGDTATPDVGDPDGGADTSSPTTDGAGVEAPILTPAGRQLAWLLGLLNGPATSITESEVAGHFHVDFVRQIPPPQLAAVLRGVAEADAPFTLVAIDEPMTHSLKAVVRGRRGMYLRITIVVYPNATDQIIGLQFSVAPERDPALRDFGELERRLQSLAEKARIQIAAVDGDACKPIHARAAGESMPLGSLFKIYVLGAVAERIAAGQLAWTTPVTIKEELKSLPSGNLQNQPAGAMLPLQDVATRMIAISDNTGTDHLIHLVGRTVVEDAQSRFGHSAPALNIPFVTTRELFQLKLGSTDGERAEYIAAAPAGRRQLLETRYSSRPLPPLSAAATWVAPRDIDKLEWFASSEDLCRAFARLKQLGEQSATAPVLTILSRNPGVEDLTGFSYVGFKGGSEPGVLAAGWLVRRSSDNAWRVVTVGLSDTSKPIDEETAIYYATATLQLAGR